MECLPNKLTPLYSKIYYKEENYLKVKTVVFKYITPLHSKGWVCGALVYRYIIFPYSKPLYILNPYYILLMWFSYPLSYSFTGFISPASYILILTYLKSRLSICTILFIKSITLTLFFISLSLKNSISKLLIRGMLYPVLI